MVGRDTPEADEEKPRFVPESELRFQSAQHDAEKFPAKRPVGTQHIGKKSTGFARVVQDTTGVTSGEMANIGLSVFQAGITSRLDTPEWVRDPKQLDEFFSKRLKAQGGSETWGMTHGLDFDTWSLTYGLDRLILQDYFLANHTDEQIFEEHEKRFAEERRALDHKLRWTSSADAVKHRRERLLRDRARFYEPPKVWTQHSWRGILVSTASGEWGALQLHGIATNKRRRKASKIADWCGLRGRFREPAEILADTIFDDRAALESWMTDQGIPLDDIIIEDFEWA
jgi:hypothetical protein